MLRTKSDALAAIRQLNTLQQRADRMLIPNQRVNATRTPDSIITTTTAVGSSGNAERVPVANVAGGSIEPLQFTMRRDTTNPRTFIFGDPTGIIAKQGGLTHTDYLSTPVGAESSGDVLEIYRRMILASTQVIIHDIRFDLPSNAAGLNGMVQTFTGEMDGAEGSRKLVFLANKFAEQSNILNREKPVNLVLDRKGALVVTLNAEDPATDVVMTLFVSGLGQKTGVAVVS